MRLRPFACLALLLLALPAGADDYVLHEWGYFLENSGIDVLDLEAQLPPEVPNWRSPREATDTTATGAGRVTMESSGMATRSAEADERVRLLRGPLVTRTIADPYLHFYADRPVEVDVRVGFPTGAPMFWWPVAEVGPESLEWRRVRVGAGDAPLHRWSGPHRSRRGVERARRVDSAALETAGTRDKYLFYDGTMSTDGFVRRRWSWDGLHLTSSLSEPVHDVLVFFEGAPCPRWFERLAPGEELVVTPASGTPVEFDETWLVAMLERGGLRHDEAQAMAGSLLETSFFEASGTGVLYRIGQATYDGIFPIALDPAPHEVVRVGAVLSFDLDHAIRATLANLETWRDRPDVVRSLRDQLRRLVGRRIADLEPLSPAMREALGVPDERIARLADLVDPGRRLSPAELDALLAAADPDLPRTVRRHVYAGGEWTPALRELAAAKPTALALPADLLE